MILSPGLVIGGKYRLERPLASGGMGSLWVARHTELGTTVAMKFMEASSTSSPILRARFEREARSAAGLRSPNVVSVMDYGLDGEAPYLVMELLQGEDLRKRLNREKRLPLDQVSRILTQAARGLRVAHEANLVHRDLKPANVFLAQMDDDEVVKILDFGIAKEVGSAVVGESTKTGELMGSPHYMSPEQVRALKDIDHRSDLWALAVIAFRASTGRLPFAGEVIGAVIGQILADPVPRASTIAPDLPPALDAFFDRGFARDREQRFQSARELADTFAAIVASAGAGSALPVPSGSFPGVPSSRPEMTSLPTMREGLGPSARPNPPTLPPPMYPTAGAAGDTGAPLSGALGPTGNPVIHTAPPPPIPPAPAKKWALVAGLLAVGAIGGGVSFALLGGSRGAAVPASGGAATVAPPANAGRTPTPPAPSAAAPSAVAAPPPAPSAEPSATAAEAEPSPRPSAAPQPSSKGASAKKKAPDWGF